jgi:hypothetical protein
MKILEQTCSLNRFKAIGKFLKGNANAEAQIWCYTSAISFNDITWTVIINIQSVNEGGGEFEFEGQVDTKIENNNNRPEIDFLLKIFYQANSLINNRLITECSVRGHGIPVTKGINETEIRSLIVSDLNEKFPPRPQ